jgi:hypothetical protein
MGQWGVSSYENDEANDALDAGFERVHGSRYDELMDDRNSLTFAQVQQRLADGRTLEASIEALWEAVGWDVEPDDWDDEARLALAGVVVRYAELRIPIPDDWRHRAIDWLEHEEIEWHEGTARRLRRQKEIELLRSAPGAGGAGDVGRPADGDRPT